MQDKQTDKRQMIEEIKEELIVYFREGYINPITIFDFEHIQFNSIYDILKIHFLLTSQVKEYILKLNKSIRDIKNSTKMEKNLFHGEIRGNIDWNKTLEYRMNTLYKDKTKFICDNIDKFYNTKENIILKKAISLINNIIHVDIDMNHFKERDWYKNGEKFSHIISNIYNSNVYIKRIDISNIKVTSKMIQDVLKNRNRVYRDSAKILKLYNDIMAMDKKHIDNLFSKTFIELKTIDEVFEFYCIFKYIRNKFKRENIKYNIVDGQEKYLASLEDEKSIYKIYHNRGATKYLKFNLSKDDLRYSNSRYLNKKIAYLDRKNEIYTQLEGRSLSNQFWGGRPDLIIIKLDKNRVIKSLEIGEVKHTDDIDYMYQGLEELLEYMYLVRDAKSNYIEDLEIKGILFVDSIKLKKEKFKNIKIINRYNMKEI